MHCKKISAVLKVNSTATYSDIEKSIYTESGWKMTTTKDGNHVLFPKWDTADSHGNLEHIRQTILKKFGCAKLKCITRRCKGKASGSYCTNSCTCKECENKTHNQFADESNNNIMDLFEDFDSVDDIDSHDEDKDDSSDVETDCNGYEQDYAYAKDDCPDDKLLELVEIINDDEDGYSDEEDIVNALLA